MSAAFSPVAAILRKREGGAHPPGEIRDLIQGFLRDEVTDYQMTAWMMAIYFRGLTAAENAELTMAMLASGRPLPPWTEGPPVVDKHSTGGVGGKVSLIVAPLAAACGLRVPMISGRALGHTGGTLDKLQSIPGYAIFLESDRFRRIVDRVGCSIVGASRDLVPADRRMYALRDVSGIVESVPLIVSSILSKKAAARLTGLVADVKVGPGAFLPDRASARDLGSRLVEAGDALGIRTTAILTRMDRPLGRTIGNALEVAEAAEWLRGEDREEDLTAVTTALAEEMLRAGGIDAAEARRRMAAALTSGAALEKLAAMIEAHGGDPRVLEDLSLIHISEPT
ncbi:MAG: thymidine phosphorylase, partial [Candidatus Eisenbacteria bacterium]|nr:thymidine phosphorylase [Candidatus Eisenbacteria bacterium]